MADRFTRAFGSFLRRIVDMGDGTFSEQVVSKPPPNMVSGDRLKVDLDEPIDVSLPASLINANRVKVEVDDPVDVVLPAAMVVANRLQVDVAQPVAVTLPANLLTNSNGPNARLRVDVGQTGFFSGKEFRTFKEWETSTTTTYVIKAVVPINIILFEFGINLDEGSARIETIAGGTPGGTFSETLPIFSTNTMTEKPQPPYVNQVVLTAGGTLSGGTLLDPLRAKTSGNTNFASSVGAAAGAERGVGPATFHYRITLTGAIGVLKARWEERP